MPRSDAPAPNVTRRPLLLSIVSAIGGTGFYHLCQLAVIALLNKFVAPELAGAYFLGYAVAMPVILFFGLELRGALVADAGGQFSYGAYRKLRNVALLPAAVVLIAYLVVYALQTDQPAFTMMLGGVFAARLAWAVAEVGWGTFQRRERLDLVAGAYALRGIALLLPFAVLLPLFATLRGGRGEKLADVAAWAAVLHAIGFVAVYYAFDRRTVRVPGLWDEAWTWRGVRALALQTLPLGLVALAVNLCDSFPRWIFTSSRVENGTAQLGYFGSLAYITQAGNLIVIQASIAAANRLSEYYQRDRRAFLKLSGRLVGAAAILGVAILLVVLACGRPLLRLLYTPEYLAFEYEFRVIVVAHALTLLTNVLGTATTQMRLFWVQVPVQILTLLTTVGAAVVLIPGPTPVRGAAYTVLARAGVQLLLYIGCFVWGATRPRGPATAPAPLAGPMGEEADY